MEYGRPASPWVSCINPLRQHADSESPDSRTCQNELSA